MTRRRIAARVGETFEVELPAQPAAGYRWRVRHSAKTLQLAEALARPERASPLIGASSAQRFIGRPQRAGRYRLRFVLERPWERRPTDAAEVSVRAKRRKHPRR